MVPLIDVCLVIASSAAIVGQDGLGGHTEVSALNVDQLIDRLPQAGFEDIWDEELSWYVKVPVVEELSRRLRDGLVMTDGQWTRALLRTRAIRLRDRWPSNMPIVASLRVPQWLYPTQIRMVPRLDGLAEVSAGALLVGLCAGYGPPSPPEIGVLPRGRHQITFEVTVERGSSMYEIMTECAAPPGVLWIGEVAFDVEVVADVDIALPPVQSVELDAAIRDSIVVRWWTDANGTRRPVLALEPDDDDACTLATTALSLEVELVQQGHPFATEMLHLLGSTYYRALHSDGKLGAVTQAGLETLPPECELDASAREGWALRVRGTSERVLEIHDAASRWNGRFEIPVAEAIGRRR